MKEFRWDDSRQLSLELEQLLKSQVFMTKVSDRLTMNKVGAKDSRIGTDAYLNEYLHQYPENS